MIELFSSQICFVKNSTFGPRVKRGHFLTDRREVEKMAEFSSRVSETRFLPRRDEIARFFMYQFLRLNSVFAKVEGLSYSQSIF